MRRRVDQMENHHSQSRAKEQNREYRWSAQAKARVMHPTRGTTVVPCRSKLAALMNAAEVWGCRLTELEGARVWAAKPGDVAEKRPYIGHSHD